MPRSARKQQEIARREEELLGIARRLLLKRGVAGLTMERIAAATAYSKGTVYQHFGSKEDVLAALARQSSLRRIALFERAALFKGRSRERMIAIGKANEVVYRLHPDYFISEIVINGRHVRERLPAARQAELQSLQDRSFAVLLGVIRDAFASGDLQPATVWLTPEKVLLGLWGISHGLYGLWNTDLPIHEWADDLFVTHHRLTNLLCDGCGWRPFSHEWDYDATVRRVWTEVFPEESAQLKEKSTRRAGTAAAGAGGATGPG